MRNEKSESKSGDKALMSPDPGMQRRKILGWMGVGIVGAITFKALPFKFFASRNSKRRHLKPEAQVAINDMAVKRGKKVSRHG